jgi:tetratricopeptide (TPR) repeat protein
LRHFNIYYFLLVLVIFGISGCATTNQAPFPLQQYHDLTSKYNAYFNAKEKTKIVLQSVQKNHKDKFDDVIPVYYYSDPKEFSPHSGELDDVEKRCAKSLQIHVYSNFADDHFLLIGKANFFKGEYDKALQNLRFVTTEYKDGVDYVKEMKRLKGKTVKASKQKKPNKKPKFEKRLNEQGNLVLEKIDSRPSYSAFVHEPARAEAMLWIAKAYTAKGQFTEAANIIQYSKSDDKFYRNLDPELILAEANLHVTKKDWDQAIPPLEKYLKMVSKKKQRLRPLVILGQLYERKGQNAKSADYYAQALKSNPGYELEFFTKMQQLKLSRKGKINLPEVRKSLLAMSKDGKYKENLDQIYFELGEIALIENNRPEARDWFAKSANSSVSNPMQKAYAHIKLAQMDYEEERYTSSNFYYDSALTGLSDKDTLYETASTRAKVLGKLVEQLNTIKAEDSLQRLAKMNTSEREKYIRNQIAKAEKEQEKAEKEKEYQASVNAEKNAANAAQVSPAANVGALWYFYNPQLRATGYNDFIKKWGKRKLEPNWRRKDKTATLDDGSAEADSGKEKSEVSESSGDSELDKYLENIPTTKDKLSASNGRIVEAYYTAGTVYKDDLNNIKKATQTYEEMLKRFPTGKFTLEGYYQLYLLAVKSNNSAKADQWKNRILDEFPKSNIASFIKDPKFFDRAKEGDKALEKFYQQAYEDYAKGRYAAAAEKCVLADNEFKVNPLKAKFDLLYAMTLAKENKLDLYVQALNKIITKHAGSPEQSKAQELLDNLNKSSLPMKDLSKLVPVDSVATPEVPATPSTPVLKAEEKPVAVIAENKPLGEKPKEEPKAVPDTKPKEEVKSQPKDSKPVATEKPKEEAKPVAEVKPKDEQKPKDEKAKPETKPAPESKPKEEAKPTTSETASSTAIADKPQSSGGGQAPPASGPVNNLANEADEDLYGASDKAPHYIVLYFTDPAAYSQLSYPMLEEYESVYAPNATLTNKGVIINSATKLVVIRQFKNKDEAMLLAKRLEADTKISLEIEPSKVHVFAISMLNYSTLITTKKLDAYLKFYQANYK